MTEYIVFFLDYLSDISPYDKKDILQKYELEVVSNMERGDEDESKYSRIPLNSYSVLTNELRRLFGQNSANALAGLISAGPETEAVRRFAGASREAIFRITESSQYFLPRLRRWATDPSNWFLIRSSRGAFELQSFISEKFPCLILENGPVECSSSGLPDVDLSNIEDILQTTGLYQLWNSGNQGQVGTVVVLDTGLNGKLRSDPGICASSVGGLSTEDSDGHGSAVIEIIRALSPKSKIESIRVLESYTSGHIWNLVAGLTQLHFKSNLIVNMSLSVSSTWVGNLGHQAIAFRESITNILSSLSSRNNFSICAAGNDSVAEIRWPAASPHALAVGSHAQSYSLSSFSNFSQTATNYILAPGGELNVQDGRIYGFGRYGIGLTRDIYGTSFSAAVASGIASLLSGYGWFSDMQIPSRISLFRNHCRKNKEGYPLINVPDIGAVWPI